MNDIRLFNTKTNIREFEYSFRSTVGRTRTVVRSIVQILTGVTGRRQNIHRGTSNHTGHVTVHSSERHCLLSSVLFGSYLWM